MSSQAIDAQYQYSKTEYFGEIANQYIANDWRPTPIRPGSKAACAYGWVNRSHNAADVQTLAGQYSKYFTGIVCGAPAEGCDLAAVGVDIDITDPEFAALAEAETRRILGDTPLRRVGLAPKVLLVYATSEVLSKAATPVFARLDDPPDHKGHRVEVLLRGQQFVAEAIHPDTGKPYCWGAATPRNTPIEAVSRVTGRQLNELIARVTALAGDAGFVVKSEGHTTVVTARTNAPTEPLSGTPPAVLATRRASPALANARTIPATWLAEIEAAAEHVHVSADYYDWRDNVLFPFASAITYAPHHEGALREIFDKVNRRTAPATADEAYFENAHRLLNDAVENQRGRT